MTEERRLSPKMAAKLGRHFVAKYKSYRDSVLGGSRVASKLEIRKVRRQENDLQKRDFQWHFDANQAVKPLIWLTANLVYPSGAAFKGKPLDFEPWQIWDTMTIFGWVDDVGNRRFTDAYISVARKNGKSSWASAILCYLSFATGESTGSPGYIAATSLDQASECFERAEKEMSNLPVKVQNSKNNKVLSWGECRIQAVSAEPKDGKLPHGCIVDEYHQFKSNDLVNSLVTGNVSDPNALTLRVTTAGTLLNGPCKQEHDKCVKILEESIAIENYFVSIYSLDDGDSWDDPSLWTKSNPNLGVSVSSQLMMGRYNYSKLSHADMIVFVTKNLNVWVDGLKRWANMSIWNEQCCIPFDPEDLQGKTCYGGLDLAHNNDFAAFCLDFPDEDSGNHHQLYWYFIPEDRTVELERQLRVPLSQWVSEGFIIATPGPVIDYDYIAKAVEDCRDSYDLKLVAADRWHLNILDQHMPEWFEELTVEFSQGWKQMSTSTSSFERAYLTGRIQSNGNPVQRWMMSCASTKTDVNGNVRLDKPDVSRSQNRIDGVIASIMAYDTAETQEGEGLNGAAEDYLTVI